jgi:hypothetical protein
LKKTNTITIPRLILKRGRDVRFSALPYEPF